LRKPRVAGKLTVSAKRLWGRREKRRTIGGKGGEERGSTRSPVGCGGLATNM